MSELRNWLKAKLDTMHPDEVVDERHTSPAPPLPEWIAAQLEGPSAPAEVHPAVVAALDLDEAELRAAGYDGIAGYFEWATSASPEDWARAAAEAGTPDLPPPTLYDLPGPLRVELENRRIRARVAEAKARRP